MRNLLILLCLVSVVLVKSDNTYEYNINRITPSVEYEVKFQEIEKHELSPRIPVRAGFQWGEGYKGRNSKKIWWEE